MKFPDESRMELRQGWMITNHLASSARGLLGFEWVERERKGEYGEGVDMEFTLVVIYGDMHRVTFNTQVRIAPSGTVEQAREYAKHQAFKRLAEWLETSLFNGDIAQWGEEAHSQIAHVEGGGVWVSPDREVLW